MSLNLQLIDFDCENEVLENYLNYHCGYHTDQNGRHYKCLIFILNEENYWHPRQNAESVHEDDEDHTFWGTEPHLVEHED